MSKFRSDADVNAKVLYLNLDGSTSRYLAICVFDWCLPKIVASSYII